MREWVEHWGSRPDERTRRYACEDVIPDARTVLYRGVTVDAPASVVWRWICQIKVAPYSYDLIDNFGKRSPRTLTPGADQLTLGETMVRVFELATFDEGRSLTMRCRSRVFGALAMTYEAVPEGATTRLLGVLALDHRTPLTAALAFGDTIMMRKQLLNLKALAERPQV